MDHAYTWLRKLVWTKFDEDCDEALVFNKRRAEEIQAQFRDTAESAPEARMQET